MRELGIRDRLEIARLDVCLKAKRVVAAWRSDGQALAPGLQALSDSLDLLHQRAQEAVVRESDIEPPGRRAS